MMFRSAQLANINPLPPQRQRADGSYGQQVGGLDDQHRCKRPLLAYAEQPKRKHPADDEAARDAGEVPEEDQKAKEDDQK